MRKCLWVAVVLFAFPMSSAAQFIPHVALFGGYTYVHAKYDSGPGGFSLNGWDGSLEVKPIPLVGLVADVSRQYASPGGVSQNQTSLLFGPQVSVPHIKRVIPFAHVMAGVVHGTNRQALAFIRDNTFATAVGGGVDIKLAGPIWLRALQVDWLHADLSPDHHTQVRLATGLVARF